MNICVYCSGSPSPYSSVDSEVYDYMNDASEPYDERHEEHNSVPRLLTAPQQLTVNTGDTVLYCVLYCTVLYLTVLYCTLLYCTVLCCAVLYCTVL